MLVLFFGDKDSPGFAQELTGFRTKIERESSRPVWIYEESFDEGSLGHEPSYAGAIETLLRDKYAKRGIDFVIAAGDYPLQFVQERRKTFLPSAKLIYFLLGHSPQQSIPNATGLVARLSLVPTLEDALTENPGTRHVLLVAGATAIDRAMAQLFLPGSLKYLQETHNEVDISILPPETLDESRARLAALPNDTVTVFICYYGDSRGERFIPGRILPMFSAITDRPMYGWLDTYLGHGIVGGSVTSAEVAGTELGNLVLRVVHGEEPGNIPEVISEFRRNEFDFQQMKRWGIGLRQIPADSIVINRQYTLWELYKWRIVGLVGLIVIEALLIVSLIRLALGQKRHVSQLAYQREVEALISQSAAVFINLPPELVNVEIEASFQRLLAFFDLDRISLFEFSAGTAQLRLLCTRGSTRSQQPSSVFDLHLFPWISAQILHGAPTVVSRLEELPAEAGALREVLRGSGIRSFAAFPLQHNQKTFATLGFSTVRMERTWDADVIQALRTISDIFGSALERKGAEEVMSANRDRLTGIIESAMDAIIAVDDQQRIVVFNATAEKIFGCPEKEVLGQSLERFIPSRFRPQHHEHISRFAKSGVTNRAMGTLGTLHAQRSNGDEFPIEASISQVKTDGNNLFTVIIRDITERERTQQELRESEVRFRLVANTAPVLIWMSGTDKLCTYFNQFWLDFTGRPLEAELGNGWAEGVHPDDFDRCLETYNQSFDRRQPFKMEYRLRAHDGEYRWLLDIGVPRLNADGTFAGFIGSCVDLSERKRAEEELRRSEELKASILESLRNHVAVLDSNGTIVAATNRGPEFKGVVGINLLDLRVGSNYLDICRMAAEKGDPDVTAALAGVQRVIDRQQSYFELEYDYESGIDRYWFLMSVTPLKSLSGGIVISHHDITERKRHEQAIQELSGRLIGAQEQERSRIARELHDDVNQQVAMLAIEIQQLKALFPQESSAEVEKIDSLWKKTHALSMDIQHLSHELHSTKLEHLGLVAALRSLCHEFSEKHKVEATFKFGQIPTSMESDIELTLFRVAQESLQNIAKHSHARKVEVELVGTAGEVILRVSDDGVGFDQDTVQNKAGLGMISMSERIRLVGGALSIYSKQPLGTKVEATIPLSRAKLAARRAS